MNARNSSRRFYRRVATRHRLFYADWPAVVRAEGEWLASLLGPLDARTVLDCTCGIGTQALGLAQQGYEVTGSDLIEENLAEAQRIAASIPDCECRIMEMTGHGSIFFRPDLFVALVTQFQTA